MLRRIAGGIILVGLATAITAAIRLPSHVVPTLDQLAVHEWGTFTTVAGEDGRAIEWLPLSGPTDLPCFVEHFETRTPSRSCPPRTLASSTTRPRARDSGARFEWKLRCCIFMAARPKARSAYTCAFRAD